GPLLDVPMSHASTGPARPRRRGRAALTVLDLPCLTGVYTIAVARHVAANAPGSRLAARPPDLDSAAEVAS
ncbi:hypothetical protein VM98_35155, partial [Streptomyces rubellomurinus subsp. indigoferus]